MLHYFYYTCKADWKVYVQGRVETIRARQNRNPNYDYRAVKVTMQKDKARKKDEERKKDKTERQGKKARKHSSYQNLKSDL